jgi:hypothetical protein
VGLCVVVTGLASSQEEVLKAKSDLLCTVAASVAYVDFYPNSMASKVRLQLSCLSPAQHLKLATHCSIRAVQQTSDSYSLSLSYAATRASTQPYFLEF